MMAHGWVRGSIVKSVTDEFARRGGDLDRVLREHGLTRKLLYGPQASVPLARYVAMFETMARKLDDPLFGAKVGLQTRPADLGGAGTIMARSRSIAAALDRLTRFVTSYQPGTLSLLDENDDLLVWTYRLGDASIWPRGQDAEFTLSATVQLIRHAFRPDWRPEQVQLEHAPVSRAAATQVQRLFGCPVQFEAPSNGLVLHAAEARMCIRNEDAELIAALEGFLVDVIPEDVRTASWSSRVLTLIATYLGQQPITLDGLAADLSTTRRSLQRRLADEGTSLRELLRNHRQDIAQRRLQAGVAHLGGLAEALGYADGSVFWRAHRNWTGKSPSNVRKGIQ